MSKEEILQLRNGGWTYQKIGDKFGVSRQRIHQKLTGYKSPFNKPKYIRELKRKTIKELYNIDTKGIKLEGRDFYREAVRLRDNYTCQACGKKWEEGTRRFDVHHIDCDNSKSKQYDRLDIEADNMITLCHKCHTRLHLSK